MSMHELVEDLRTRLASSVSAGAKRPEGSTPTGASSWHATGSTVSSMRAARSSS